jgi:glycopeptide antibiotics resistance protein
VAWFGVLLAVVRPWHGYVGHPHWNSVAWIPFVSWPHKFGDELGNTVLFFPWGALQAAAFPAASRSRTVGRVAAVALVTSATCEFCQVFSHNRFASVTDVVTNVGGAVLGAWLIARRSGA